MNAKRKGTAWEHRSKRLLEALGYAVIRAVGGQALGDSVTVSSTDTLQVGEASCTGSRVAPKVRCLLRRDFTWGAGHLVSS